MQIRLRISTETPPTHSASNPSPRHKDTGATTAPQKPSQCVMLPTALEGQSGDRSRREAMLTAGNPSASKALRAQARPVRNSLCLASTACATALYSTSESDARSSSAVAARKAAPDGKRDVSKGSRCLGDSGITVSGTILITSSSEARTREQRRLTPHARRQSSIYRIHSPNPSLGMKRHTDCRFVLARARIRETRFMWITFRGRFNRGSKRRSERNAASESF